MPQDYHIYLHSAGESTDNQTMPFDNRPKPTGGNTDPNSNGPSAPFVMQSINTVDQIISGQDMVGKGINSGVAALAKASPWVAATIALGKVADKVITTGFEHLSTYRGRFEYSMEYNNAKVQFGNMFNPFKYLYNTYHTQKQYDLQNMKIQEQRRLTGNSVYTNYSTRGV